MSLLGFVWEFEAEGKGREDFMVANIRENGEVFEKKLNIYFFREW